jgi:hypothetical protein
MSNLISRDVIVPAAEARFQAICAMTSCEVFERLPLLDGYLPDEIKEAAAALDDRDNTAFAILSGYRAAIDAVGVYARRSVRRQLAAAEDALSAGRLCVAVETGRLGPVVCGVLDDRDDAMCALDKLLRVARDTLTARP